MDPSIIYNNTDYSIVLIDIPRSIEEAQGFPIPLPIRLLSTLPRTIPYPSTEPKDEKTRSDLPQASLDALLLERRIQFVLSYVQKDHKGLWCLPRAILPEKLLKEPSPNGNEESRTQIKEEPMDDASGITENATSEFTTANIKEESPEFTSRKISKVQNSTDDSDPWNEPPIAYRDIRALRGLFYQNPTPETVVLGEEQIYLPPKSTALCGFIEATSDLFMSAPDFNLMIMDPPWPNRSAIRKGWYHTWSFDEILTTFNEIPIASKLAKDGIIAIWITNKPAHREIVLGIGGIFPSRGIELIEEWVWLKTTSIGEPVTPLDGVWRKPYEILLVGRKTEGPGEEGRDLVRRVVLGVPDLHSRKPNLKSVFEKVFGLKEGNYEALEVFARNMTAGWWAWGFECLKFQGLEYWTPDSDDCIAEAVVECLDPRM